MKHKILGVRHVKTKTMNDKKELSREEIIKNAHANRFQHKYSDEWILDAMNEFAKLQCIAFADWLGDGNIPAYTEEEWESVTNEQLYEIFNSEQNLEVSDTTKAK